MKKQLIFLASVLIFTACKPQESTPVLNPDLVPYNYSNGGICVSLPTTFTPNGDGKNDFYTPITSETSLGDFYFSVSDSKGKSLYYTYSLDSAGWDGYNTSTNKYYPAAVYKATLAFDNGLGMRVIKEFNFTILPYDSTNKCWKTNGVTYYFPDQFSTNTCQPAIPTMENYCP